MANEEQVRILREEGVKAWNRWREEHPGVRPDLSGANLRGADLEGVNLREAKLTSINLTSAKLREADLTGTDLEDAKLVGADLRGIELSASRLMRADLKYANLGISSPLFLPLFSDLSKADLTSSDLSHATLVGVGLDGANLQHAQLEWAVLDGSTLEAANLTRANLRNTHLNDVILSEANFCEATVGGTRFGNVDLRSIRGLDTVIHTRPSTIGIDTIYRSGGKIPEIFLRGCGVPDSFISYISSLVGQPLQFYSCFISYSSKDQVFAERLHADLQAKGVRCWFAPEDMKTGDKIWERLDQSIRLHDKLLVILSDNAIGSDWVENEVMAAVEEERKRKKTVLFPVRLDDAVMASGEAWAGLVRQRHIGDFREWKEHDAYREGFERLMRDLKAEG